MRDTKLRIYGQLTISIISFGCFYLSSVIEGNISIWKLLVYVFVTTFIVWEALRVFIQLARRQFPTIGQTRQRLVMVTILTLFLVALFPLVKYGFGDLIQLYGNAEKHSGGIRVYDYLRIMGQNIFYCLFIAAAYEAIYFFELWKQMFQQSEALKKEQLAGQLHSLKEQVSPHFLFNSLNTLSSLVSRDAGKAERFIEEMATVYRYLLEVGDKYLVTLDEELSFAEAYIHLLQTRYNQHFSVTIAIDPEYRKCMLPPLTLQLLIENAVKHNVVDSRHPLELFIQSKADHTLLVQNRIQKKRQPVRSEKKGLVNIMERYALLELPPVEVEERDEHFIVSVPLKPMVVYAGADY
jgi:hypothetical protein